MNLFKKISSLFIALCICVGASSCSDKDKSSKADDGDVINVTVATAELGDISSTADYTGEIVGSETASVSAKVSGEAKTVFVKEGDFVNEGDTLLTIDAVSYQLAYNQTLAAYNSAVSGKKSAEANYNSVTGGSTQQSLSQLETALNAAKIAYDDALDMYNKNLALYEAGAISQVMFNSYKNALENARLSYENAKTNYEITKNIVVNETQNSAQAGVDSAASAISQAKAALDIAKNNLDGCTVKAPISGYVSQKNVSRGQMVSPGAPIFTITNTSSVEVSINVTESVITHIDETTQATVSIPSAGVSDITGTVSSFNPVKNSATGLYAVKVAIPNDDGALKGGMVSNIKLVTESTSNGITIPSSALMQSDEEGYFVYVADGDIAEKRLVELGIQNNEFTQILSGVKADEQVIVNGKEYISEDNKKIKIVTE